MQSFQRVGPPAAPFAGYFETSDAQLDAHRARRVVADDAHAFACRASLMDAAVGEEVVLVAHECQSAPSADRGAGAIDVRTNAHPTVPAAADIPDIIRRRLIPVRAYDADGWMIDAEVCRGTEAAGEVERMFAARAVVNIHLHDARRGGFACRVNRPT